jgi:hypothetical protein|tara:strand:+ start:1943 stop:2086 length:144 start_codon:yes stop_codon:yes gene_type:complete
MALFNWSIIRAFVFGPPSDKNAKHMIFKLRSQTPHDMRNFELISSYF